MSNLSFDTFRLLFFVILFSAVIGAYCTTIDYRIQKDLPLITKYCFCPSCGHKLAVIHQIPVISWFFLRGKCHYCREAIPVRYPLIEGSFIFFYSMVFLIFNSHPAVYVSLWYLSVTLFLFFRSRRHYKSLLKGLFIIYCYHLVFTSVLLAVLMALDIPAR